MTELQTFGEKPAGYGGHWPREDDILVAVRTRDSSLLELSNFEVAMKRLEEACDEAGVDRYDEWPERMWPGQEVHPVREGALILWRAKHWAIGWIEYLGVKHDAPARVLDEARRIAEHLDSIYPVLDEEDWSRRQADAAQEIWDDMNEDERREALEACGLPTDDVPEVPPAEVWEEIGVTG